MVAFFLSFFFFCLFLYASPTRFRCVHAPTRLSTRARSLVYTHTLSHYGIACASRRRSCELGPWSGAILLFAVRPTPTRFVFRALACPALASVLHAPLRCTTAAYTLFDFELGPCGTRTCSMLTLWSICINNTPMLLKIYKFIGR